MVVAMQVCKKCMEEKLRNLRLTLLFAMILTNDSERLNVFLVNRLRQTNLGYLMS